MLKFDFGWSSAVDLTGGAHDTPTYPVARILRARKRKRKGRRKGKRQEK